MKRSGPVLLLIVVCVLSGPGYAQTDSEDLPPEVLAFPDIVLFNGKILTVDEEFSMAQAVAVRGERLLGVGSDVRILKMAGPETRRIDLQGKTVVPGLIDTHDHLSSYAISYMTLLDKEVEWEGQIETQALLWEEADVALGDIKRAVDAASPGEFVRVFTRTPGPLEGVTMSQLDALSPENPVVVAQTISAAAGGPEHKSHRVGPDTPGYPRIPPVCPARDPS